MRLAVASLAAGLIWLAGLGLWWLTLAAGVGIGLPGVWWLVLLGPVLAITLGHQARGRIRETGADRAGTGVATAGLVLGYLELAITLLGVVALIALAWSFRNYTF